MGKRIVEAQLDIFSDKISTAIPVSYIGQLDWIYVKVRKPQKPQGAKALKNEDFKDHEFWPDMYARTKQRDAFYSKYKKRENSSIYYRNSVTITTSVSIPPRSIPTEYIPNKPLMRIPVSLDKYESKTDLDATRLEGNVVELSFMGPLENPILRNRTTGRQVVLEYSLGAGEESTFYVWWDNAIGELVYRFLNLTVLWEMAADRNTIEFLAKAGIEDGGSARIVIPA